MIKNFEVDKYENLKFKTGAGRCVCQKAGNQGLSHRLLDILDTVAI